MFTIVTPVGITGPSHAAAQEAETTRGDAASNAAVADF
jgi:hypothetical protein